MYVHTYTHIVHFDDLCFILLLIDLLSVECGLFGYLDSMGFGTVSMYLDFMRVDRVEVQWKHVVQVFM